MLMSKTPVDTSGDVNVRVASNLSKVPFIATDASTSNLTELSTGVISKTGACARLTDGSTVEAKRQRIVSLMLGSVNLTRFVVNNSIQKTSKRMTVDTGIPFVNPV